MTNNEKISEFDAKKEKVKRIMAAIALIAIGMSIIAGCICMAIGNIQLVIAACFCLVIIPIMAYCFIMVYDRVHKDDAFKPEAAAYEEVPETGDKSEE